MNEMVKMYEMLNDEQRKNLFSEEQRKCLDGLVFYKKLFNDKAFYNAVETAVGEAAYEELRFN